MIKNNKKERRIQKVRKMIRAKSGLPRLSVFRSALHIYGQIIDDEKGETLVSASDFDLSSSRVKLTAGQDKKSLNKKSVVAFKIGELIAKRALEKNIKKIVFDRGGYKYHGRVRSVAEGARKGGLSF